MYSQIKQILVQRLPRLAELDYWCKIEFIPPSKYEKYPAEFYEKDIKKQDVYIWNWIWTIAYRDHSSRNDTYYHEIGKWQGWYHSYKHIKTTHIESMIKDGKCIVLWKDQSHADILEVLGEDWAMDSKWYLLQDEWLLYISYQPVLLETENWEVFIQLPRDLHDLDKPEYQETVKHLISLLTK